MERLNKMAVRKMTADSQEYKESNMWIVNGTPQELWDIIFDTNKIAFSLVGLNAQQRLKKSVVKKYYRTKKELV
jgi:hypothetical protein